MKIWQLRLTRAALSLLIIVGASILVWAQGPAPLGGDQPRYATLGLNLLDHGVFSAEPYTSHGQPAPTLAWAGPVIAAELALAAAIHQGTHTDLECLAAHKVDCDMRLPALRFIHIIELLVFLGCLWWISFLILGNEWLAWLVTFLSLSFRDVLDTANVAQTEPLYLMLYGMFAAVLVAAYIERRGALWWALAGALPGLAILCKSSLMVLIVGLPAFLVGEALLRRDTVGPPLLTSLCLVAGATLIVGAWMARSAVLFDSLALTDPIYLEASLAHRLAYNRMTWFEWLGGWLYYLPDFGDDLARSLFGRESLERLSFGPQGYYAYGYGVLHAEAHAHTAPAPATGYLMQTYMLGEPVKFSAVSALLMWRGIFVGRLMGVLGLLATVYALFTLPPQKRRPMILLAAVAFTLAAAHAALSVSIPRYNLALVPVYAISVAWLASRAWALVGRQRNEETSSA